VRKPGLQVQGLECRTVPATLDFSNGTVLFTGASGINDTLTVTQANGFYTVSDSADTIALTPTAVSAGWSGSGTNAVTGPTAGAANLSFGLAGGSDTLGTVLAGAANLTVTGAASLDVAGLVSTSGTVTISGVNAVTDVTGVGSLQSTASTRTNPTTIFLSAGNEIGTAGNNLIISANANVSATAGSGGVFITSTNGMSVTASASGVGNVSVTNTSGPLAVSSGGIDSSAAITGNVSLSCAGSVTLNGNIGSNQFSGTISIAADTSGTTTSTKTAAYEQNGQFLTTTSTSSSAATITVNTPTSGVGYADLGQGSIGGTGGGTITVYSYGGSIAWSNASALGTWSSTAPQTGIDGAGSNSAVLAASNYVFSTTGNGGIGTSARPIQAASYAFKQNQGGPNSAKGSATLSAGTGGIYLVDWAPGGAINSALTLDSAIAAGGTIRVATAMATGHPLWVSGQVWTGSGSIELYSDDNITLQGATIGGVYQGVPYSGTVDLEANRDAAHGQTLSMEDGSSITTTASKGTVINLTDAPSIDGYDFVDTYIPAGGVDLENVTCGNGGTIVVNAAADAGAEGLDSNQQGSIIQQNNTSLNAGPNGTVDLTARAWDTSNNTPVGSIGVGVQGAQSQTPYAAEPFPVTIAAGTIKVSTTGTTLSGSGAVNIVTLDPATVTVLSGANPTSTAYQADNLDANITIQGESAAGPLTVAAVATGPGTATSGEYAGTITLSDPVGVVVAGSLGNSTTGLITVTGPLSGSGTISLGTNKLVLSQSAPSVFAGVISGHHSVDVGGGGTLTLTATENYTLGTTIEPGTTLLVNGSIATCGGVTVDAGAVLGGDGTLGAVTVYGTLAPGTPGATGILTTGQLTFDSTGALEINLNGTTPGSGYSQVVASGPIALNGATLIVQIGSSLTVTTADSFDILVNTSGQAITGTFANLPEGGAGTTSNGPTYQATYLGGISGYDVVLTLLP
jgi:hypothetical protein